MTTMTKTTVPLLLWSVDDCWLDGVDGRLPDVSGFVALRRSCWIQTTTPTTKWTKCFLQSGLTFWQSYFDTWHTQVNQWTTSILTIMNRAEANLLSFSGSESESESELLSLESINTLFITVFITHYNILLTSMKLAAESSAVTAVSYTHLTLPTNREV